MTSVFGLCLVVRMIFSLLDDESEGSPVRVCAALAGAADDILLGSAPAANNHR